jgi:hypothetical protein
MWHVLWNGMHVRRLLNLFLDILPYRESQAVFLNPDGSILSMGKKAAERCEIAPCDVIGKNYSVLFDKDSGRKQYYAELLNRASTVSSYSQPVTIVKQDGLICTINLHFNAVRGEKNEILGFSFRHKILE